MKKLLAILLAAAMLFSFAACGESGGEESADPFCIRIRTSDFQIFPLMLLYRQLELLVYTEKELNEIKQEAQNHAQGSGQDQKRNCGVD